MGQQNARTVKCLTRWQRKQIVGSLKQLGMEQMIGTGREDGTGKRCRMALARRHNGKMTPCGRMEVNGQNGMPALMLIGVADGVQLDPLVLDHAAVQVSNATQETVMRDGRVNDGRMTDG